MIIKGINLKQSLQGSGITQEEAAIKLGISRPTLSVWCNKDELSEQIILKVKEKLNIDLTKVRSYTPDQEDSFVKEDQEEYYVKSSDLISQLKHQLDDKDVLYKALINEKDLRLSEKDDMIRLLKDQIAMKSLEKDTNPTTRTIPR